MATDFCSIFRIGISTGLLRRFLKLTRYSDGEAGLRLWPRGKMSAVVVAGELSGDVIMQ